MIAIVFFPQAKRIRSTDFHYITSYSDQNKKAHTLCVYRLQWSELMPYTHSYADGRNTAVYEVWCKALIQHLGPPQKERRISPGPIRGFSTT